MDDTSESVQTGRRAKARLRLNLPATLTSIDGDHKCLLVNLSGNGARIEVDHPPKVGRTAVLACADLDAMVTIVWVTEGECGVEFDEDEDAAPELLLQLRQIAAHYDKDEAERNNAASDWSGGACR